MSRIRPAFLISFCILAIAFLLSAALPAIAADLNVQPDGQGQYATIADAVAAAEDGDTIWLRAGTYTGTGNRDVVVWRNIEIRAHDFPEATVIDCDGSTYNPHRAFVTEYSDVTFYGLTIIGGHHTNGGAMTVEEGHVTLEFCELRDNEADAFGGAIQAFEYAQVTCERSIFAGNLIDADNGGGGAIHALQGAQVSLSQCTLVANGAVNGGHVYLETDGSVVIDRSLLVFADEGSAVADYYSPNATVTCSDSYGNRDGDWNGSLSGLYGQDGNISADPLLADPLGDDPDYALTVGSPAWVGADPCNHMGAVIYDGHPGPPIYGINSYSWNPSMFACLQDAMDVIPDGAILDVEGSFTGEGNIDLDPQGKAMTVRRRAGADHAWISLYSTEGHAVLVLDDGEGPGTVFENIEFHGDFAGRLLEVAGPVGARFVGCEFKNAESATGAVDIAGTPGSPATVAFEDCLFHTNQGDSCSAIHATDWQVSLNDVEFYSSHTIGDGASLELRSCKGTIRGCLFQWSIGTATLKIVDEPGASLRLAGCQFVDNRCHDFANIEADLSGNLILDSCVFEESSSYSTGGRMVIRGVAGADPVLTMDDCLFGLLHDIEDDGGAMVLTDLTANLTCCVFEGTETTGRGGALAAEGCTLDLFECRFDDTRAGRNGGAIHLTDCDAVIAESGFTGCEANLDDADYSYGGALYVESGSARLEDTRITGCKAFRGAIASLNATERVRIYADNVLMADNTSDHIGPAVFLAGSDVSAEFQQCTLDGNEVGTSDEAGQLVATSYARIDLQHCLITGSQTAAAYHGPSDEVYAYCCNIWGNAGGDWTGPLADQLGDDENISVDPEYCEPAAGNYRLAANSVCLPDNNACSTQIGAFGLGCVGPVAVYDAPAVTAVSLAPASPNPFNPRTVLAYDLPRPATVALAVYDLRGQRVRTLCPGELRESGRHEVTWHGDDDRGRSLSSGVYLVRLVAGRETSTRRVALVR